MDAGADLLPDDDSPPSGIRVLVVEAAAPVANDVARDVLPEVAHEVFREVWTLVQALSPLQGAWLRVGIRPIGCAVLTALGWRGNDGTRLLGPGGSPGAVLGMVRERWPELVPGHAAMDCLAGLLVAALCR